MGETRTNLGPCPRERCLGEGDHKCLERQPKSVNDVHYMKGLEESQLWRLGDSLYSRTAARKRRKAPVKEQSRPHLPERPFRTQPGGNLRKFPRGLGQFPLSSPAESRWGPAPPMKLLCSLTGDQGTGWAVLAWVNGASRRAKGWAGEKDARNQGSTRPPR
jgi:hypothetical protein